MLTQALHFSTHRFSELAKCLVCRARGKKRGHQWMLDDSHEASYDDISVFVIPLHNREEDWLPGWHTASVFPYSGAIQHQPETEGFLLHTYALFQQNHLQWNLKCTASTWHGMNKISFLRTCQRSTVGNKSLSFLIVGPRRTFKGGHMQAKGHF